MTHQPRSLWAVVSAVGLLLVVWLTAGGSPVPDDELPPVAQPTPVAAGPYCGITCLYNALRLIDREVEFDALASELYVSDAGSTAEQLRQAADNSGAHARVLNGLTSASLRAARDPILLHVRKPGRDTAYNHWVLFLGCDGGMARVSDPPTAVGVVPLAELLAVWDGTGVLVSAHDRSVMAVGWASWADAALAFALAFVAVAGVRETAGDRAAGMRFVAVTCGTVLAAVAWNGLRADGLLGNRAAVGSVIEKHGTTDAKPVSYEEFATLHGESGTVVIDARIPEDYATGHVPGAVSIPITLGWLDRRRAVAALPAGRPIVVYCQSEGCRWADTIAAACVAFGYERVHLFRGGYVEWQRHANDRVGR